MTELRVLLREARNVCRSGRRSDDFLTLFDAMIEESGTMDQMFVISRYYYVLRVY